MTTLFLGIVDVGYSGEGGAKTTGEVAQHLEDKYHIMRIFYEENEKFIGSTIADQIAGQIESLAQGKPMNGLNLTPAMSKVDARFRQFLSSDEMSRILPKTQQIAAAQAGVSHRKKHPYSKKNKARPAFVDTGLYSASFRSWVE